MDYDLAPALGIDGDDLSRAPVGVPETAVAPAWRLAEHDSGHQCLRFGHCPSPVFGNRGRFQSAKNPASTGTGTSTSGGTTCSWPSRTRCRPLGRASATCLPTAIIHSGPAPPTRTRDS